MDNGEILNEKKTEPFYGIIIVQCICVAVILLSVVTVKFFFKPTYQKVQKWYKENITVDTDIKQVIEASGDVSEV